MSQMNQDDDQNYILGVVGAIILAVLIGVVSLSINVSDSSNTNTSNQSSENTPAIFMGNFDFSVSNRKITLSGEVVDEKAKSSLLNPAKLLWGNDNVIDQLTVKVDAKKFWWNIKPLEVLSKLKQIPDFKLHLGDNKITGNAIVGSEAAKDNLLTGLKKWFTSDAQSEVNIDVDAKYASDLVDPNTLLNLSIEYATGASDVPESVKPVLNQIATILKEDPRKIAINGHTDNVGVPVENKSLSLTRAEKIKAYLESQGVDAGQLSAAGFGDSKPLADNSSDSGKAKNRRIEFSSQ